MVGFSDKEMAQLKKVPLFQGFRTPELHRLIYKTLQGSFRKYAQEETVMQQGRPICALCCLARGEVEIGIGQQVKNGRRWIRLCRLQAPAVFGEELAFAGQNCQIEIVARRPSVVYFLPGKILMEKYREPGVDRVIVRLLPLMRRKLQSLEGRLFVLQDATLKGRILRMSLIERSAGGSADFWNRSSEEEISAMLGCKRQALHRAFLNLEQEGILGRQGNGWRLKKDFEEQLRQISGRMELPEECLSEQDMQKLIDGWKSPGGMSAIMQMLCTLSIRIETVNHELMMCQIDTVRVRLLNYLLECGQLTKEDTISVLAERLEVNRKSMGIAVGEMEEEGILGRERGQIWVRMPRERLQELLVNEVSGQDVSELTAVSDEFCQISTEATDSTEGQKERKSMIDTTMSMRSIVKLEPMFGDFLRMKGFPFTVKNPITALVTFEDVVERKKLDKEKFLQEYEIWKESRRGQG